jgi:uncharacterized SAM-binding protein YcdF (DUF218 family)
MFFNFAKMLEPLVTPLGLCMGLWLVALVLRWHGRRQWSTLCAVTGAVLLLSFSSPLVGDVLLGELEDDFVVQSAGDSPSAEAIVVLGGVTVPPIPPRVVVEVEGGIDRLLHGLRLYRAGKAPLLVFSGGTIEWLSGSTMSEADQFLQLAVECGIDPGAVILEDHSRNTYENAIHTRGILERRGLERILLVTSASHMRRALAVFRTQGIEAIPAPTDVRVVDRSFGLLRLIPSVSGLEKSSIATKEYVGWWVYRLRGWIR